METATGSKSSYPLRDVAVLEVLCMANKQNGGKEGMKRGVRGAPEDTEGHTESLLTGTSASTADRALSFCRAKPADKEQHARGGGIGQKKGTTKTGETTAGVPEKQAKEEPDRCGTRAACRRRSSAKASYRRS